MMVGAMILLVVCAYVFGYACGFTTGVSETEQRWSDAVKKAINPEMANILRFLMTKYDQRALEIVLGDGLVAEIQRVLKRIDYGGVE